MKKWFVLAFTASLASICAAQTKPAANKIQTIASTAKQVKKTPVSSLPPVKQEQKKPVSFSMSMIENGRIDPAYEGFPVSEIVAAVQKITGTSKGEFESTADFNARKIASLNEKVIGESTLNDYFALALPVKKGGKYKDGLAYDFNADTGEVRLFALPNKLSMNGIGAPDYDTNKRQYTDLDQFDVDFKVIAKDTYEASNAYGATVVVEKTMSVRLGVAVNKIPFLSARREKAYTDPSPVAQFTLENANAAKELPALKALIVMKIASPYLIYDYFYAKPTRDDPKEMSMQSKYLTGNILGIVFYSGITGEVLGRVPASFGQPEAKQEVNAQAQTAQPERQ